MWQHWKIYKKKIYVKQIKVLSGQFYLNDLSMMHLELQKQIVKNLNTCFQRESILREWEIRYICFSKRRKQIYVHSSKEFYPWTIT